MSKRRRNSKSTVHVERVDPDVVDEAAAAIRHVVRVGTLKVALDVGEILFKTIFQQQLELVRKRGPKDASFNRLAARADVGLSKATLWRCVAIYELNQRMPLLAASTHLGVTHIRSVLGLPHGIQRMLLERADSAKIDARALQREASAHRTGRGGRPAKPPLVRAIDALMAVAAIPVEALADRNVASRLTDEERAAALEMLDELNTRTKAMRLAVRRPRGAR